MHARRLGACTLAAALCATAASASAPAAAGGRTRPPADAQCPRDHLTSYAGRAQTWGRAVGRTDLGIATDWGTTESVTLLHPGTDDASRWFRYEGRPFVAADWARIEVRPGVLRPGVRVVAWVCDDGRQPLLDWQPPRER